MTKKRPPARKNPRIDLDWGLGLTWVLAEHLNARDRELYRDWTPDRILKDLFRRLRSAEMELEVLRIPPQDMRRKKRKRARSVKKGN